MMSNAAPTAMIAGAFRAARLSASQRSCFGVPRPTQMKSAFAAFNLVDHRRVLLGSERSEGWGLAPCDDEARVTRRELRRQPFGDTLTTPVEEMSDTLARPRFAMSGRTSSPHTRSIR